MTAKTTTDVIRDALYRPRWTVRRAGSHRIGTFGRGWYAEYGNAHSGPEFGAWLPTWHEAMRFVAGQIEQHQRRMDEVHASRAVRRSASITEEQR
ncbi:hypothetical protein [Plantibacter sp. YIM 135249]|uniref:hypothetical protein n=1 Tax=Plantibacter sp. YIM 135249 TaxID=3423918 RepID=UPI003D32D765